MNKIENTNILVGEFLFPLLGFWFFGWDLYFIFLFVILDRAVKLILLQKRLQQGESTSIKKNRTFIYSFLVFTTEVVSMHLLVFVQNEHFPFYQSMESFWTYEEMGIQQGPLLLPMLIITEWLSIKREKAIKNYNGYQTVKKWNVQSIYKSVLLIVLVGASFLIPLTETLLVHIFLSIYLFFVFLNLRNGKPSSISK